MKKFFIITFFTFISSYMFTQNIYCDARFGYAQNGTIFVFSDQSVVVPVDPWGTYYSLSWEWDFGDGNISNLQNPTHNYNDGYFIPCLSLTFFDSTIMSFCTSLTCDTISTDLTPIEDHASNKKIFKIINIYGRQSKKENNKFLFYIYDDGSVDKKIMIE